MQLSVRTHGRGQVGIEHIPAHPQDFDTKYVNLSGYCGPINPHTFAAAPDLLGELKRMVEHFEPWVEYHKDDATAETWAALWSAKTAIAKAERR